MGDTAKVIVGEPPKSGTGTNNNLVGETTKILRFVWGPPEYCRGTTMNPVGRPPNSRGETIINLVGGPPEILRGTTKNTMGGQQKIQRG